MRPSRMLVPGLAGMVGLHVFMLAGHGRSHDVPMVSQMGVSAMGLHAGPSVSRSLLPVPPLPAGHHGTGTAMTVACLAVLAGLLLLLPGRQGRLVAERPPWPTVIGRPVGPELAGARTPSLAELCISLT
jgi:hypothetical protein